MLINYFRSTLRHLWKKSTYSLLNIAGLAMGIACATLIFLWVEDEFSFDQQFPRRSQLYQIRLNMNYAGAITSYPVVPGPMSDAIKGLIPGVINSARLRTETNLFTLGDKVINADGALVDSSFFSMMQLPFVKGSPTTAFLHLHSLVLTEKMARKFFGETDPVGKTLRVNNDQDYTITGVIRDLPNNVTFNFDWLTPVQNFLATNKWINAWGNYGITTIVELTPGTNTQSVDRQLTALIQPKDKEYTKAECLLWAMKDWHLYDNYTNGKPDGGQIKYVKLFSIIAWIILLIACINFMNLSTARAGQRAREVGVRKTLGALKNSLIIQFITESLFLSFLSVLLSTALVYSFLPVFNTLVDKQLTFHPFEPFHLAGLLVIGLICGILAGSYPAFYLSSFHPVAVLKGLRLHTNTGAGFIRKGLVITQFTASVTLIVCTVIVYQQLQHVKSRDLGFAKQNLLYTNMQGKMTDHYESIRVDLLRTGVVENVAASFSPPLHMWSATNTEHFTWKGSDPNSKIMVNWESVAPEYVSTVGLQLKAGRDFYSDLKADSGTVLINESMAKLMGKAGVVGSPFISEGRNFTVIGIVKDFVFNNVYGAANPLVISCEAGNFRYHHSLTIRLKPDMDLQTAIAKIQTVIRTDNPGYPPDYWFADDVFNQFFITETRIGNLAGLFAILAIFISCLGLFGLAAYTAERRTKEIGIRKVLGASASGLAGLLSREFLLLVGLSCLVAFPLAWWTMNNWLADYEYRISIHWWVFGLAGTAALIIALATVSFQAIRAALANPVKTLRSE
ncbi:MAG TPA: ABC transporter permease [Puia sp.]|nr:ABC transporter permease [Puia sp.]